MGQIRALAVLALLSGAAAIAAALEWLPAALEWVFKPLTTVVIIALAWRHGVGQTALQKRLVLAGLILSLIGDVALLWRPHGFLIGLVAFLLAHLTYIATFCVPVRLAARKLPFVVYAAIAALILAQLWPGVPAGLRGPVVAYVVCLAAMAAQAAAWRLARPGPPATWAAFGGLLFLTSDTLLAINRFGTPLPSASLWILATYWAAQWAIAMSLVRGTRATSTFP